MNIIDLSIEQAWLLGALLECIFYGLFLAFVVATLHYLATRRQERKQNPLLLITVLFMLSVSTVHAVVTFMTAFEALNTSSPTTYRVNLSKSDKVLGTLTVNLQIIAGDMFLIYRCFVVWGRKWPIVTLPILSLIGTAVGGLGETALLASTVPGTEEFFKRVTPWIVPAAVTSFCTNALCTGLIAFKIWACQRQLRLVTRSTPSLGHSALIIVIESAAVYLAAVTALLILNIVGSNGETVLADIVPSLIGISFTAIIIRMALGLTSNNGLPVELTSTAPESRHIVTIGGSRRSVDGEVELGNFAGGARIRVDRVVQRKTDLESNESVV